MAKIKTFIQIASKNVKKMIFFFNNLPLPICLSLKNASEQELEKTIFIVYNGDLYLSEELSKTLLQEFSDQSGSKDNFNYNSLTSREVQMIQLPADGFYTREIAEKRIISNKIMNRNKTNILKKLNLRNTAHLVKMALQKVIIMN